MTLDTLGAILTILKYGVILAIVYIVVNFLTPMTTSLASLMDRLSPEPTVEVIGSQRVISSLRGIGRLVTVTSEPHTRQVHIGISQGIFGLTSYGANHTARGIIEAGIDFKRIRNDALRCEETCALTVPAPRITSCNIVELSQSEKSLTIGGRDWELLRKIGQHEAIQGFIDDVTERLNILDKAKEETELALGEFVSALIEKPVHVVFDESLSAAALPDTCVPDPPAGWRKDPESGVWSRRD